MSASLVGSEMCIRDRLLSISSPGPAGVAEACGNSHRPGRSPKLWPISVSYTHLTLPTICSV
eukprot:14760112-Alexandrium_andersonii.AAC.1